MSRPDIPKSPVPMLTEVVQINGSLRPAVLPWTSTQETVDSALSGLPDQEVLAQKVIERVESQLAELLPELLRQSVDDVIREHLGDNPKVP
jgi:predicted thioredoxin/glutaredoxin